MYRYATNSVHEVFKKFTLIETSTDEIKNLDIASTKIVLL